MAGVKGMRRKISKFSQEQANDIVLKIEEGLTLPQICRQYYPHLKPSSILGWKRLHPEFKEAYTTAVESRMELWVDQMYELAAEAMPEGLSTVERATFKEDRKVRIQAIQYLASKHAPKLFGDKVQVEHQGNQAPVFNIVNWQPESLGQRVEKIITKVETEEED